MTGQMGRGDAKKRKQRAGSKSWSVKEAVVPMVSVNLGKL